MLGQSKVVKGTTNGGRLIFICDNRPDLILDIWRDTDCEVKFNPTTIQFSAVKLMAAVSSDARRFKWIPSSPAFYYWQAPLARCINAGRARWYGMKVVFEAHLPGLWTWPVSIPTSSDEIRDGNGYYWRPGKLDQMGLWRNWSVW